MIPSPDCTLCSLHSGRNRIVMPSGDVDSRVAFVGEAPGENEDVQGKPFVGRSGKLLDRIMQEEGLQRSKVMITNTVKCRPPANRDPTEEEMEACRPFLESELVTKDIVICLGRSACRSLLGYTGKLGEIANTRMTKRIGDKDITIIPTYHPAACIYSHEARDGLRKTIREIKGEFFNDPDE